VQAQCSMPNPQTLPLIFKFSNFQIRMKSLFIISALLLNFSLSAQNSKGWHLKDKATEKVYGISLDRAYEFVKDRTATPVIVAVIDSGVDTLHEDLQPVLWRNPREIPGNGIDDDHNGYVDDIFGWNFLGGKDGRNVGKDSHETDRVYHQYREQFSAVTSDTMLSEQDKSAYILWKRAAREKERSIRPAAELAGLKAYLKQLQFHDSILRIALQKDKFTGEELGNYEATSESVKQSKLAFHGFLKRNNALLNTNDDILRNFSQWLKGEVEKAHAGQQAPTDYRAAIVKDDYSNFADRFYGNPDVKGPDPFHGTHVSGIIGAVRNNEKGIDGVAGNVKVMTLRAVPDGDEHDKDIALAIRYAVDHGARIINMSFGKGLSPEKGWVDEAVRYAERKGVLIVHAAGNEHQNIDTSWNFPSSVYTGGKRAANWITVGASADAIKGELPAGFSNYGKKEVDVFAPGVQIISTIPGGNKYGPASGTSMAAPVVSGLAAFLLSYYPKLTAKDLKYVLETSAIKEPALGNSCVTGGVVNAYEAVKLAAKYKKRSAKGR